MIEGVFADRWDWWVENLATFAGASNNVGQSDGIINIYSPDFWLLPDI